MPTKIHKLDKILEGEINMVKEDPAQLEGSGDNWVVQDKPQRK